MGERDMNVSHCHQCSNFLMTNNNTNEQVCWLDWSFLPKVWISAFACEEVLVNVDFKLEIYLQRMGDFRKAWTNTPSLIELVS
jgi:hypothetical protein